MQEAKRINLVRQADPDAVVTATGQGVQSRRGRWMKALRRGLSLCCLLSVLQGAAQAATETWDGGSTVDGNWTTNENWLDNTAPVAGDTLIFPAGVTRLGTNNDFPIGMNFAAITVSDAYTITGNTLTIAAAGLLTVNNTAGTANLSLGIGTTTAGLAKSGAGALSINTISTFTGATTITAGNVILNVSQPPLGTLSGSNYTVSGTGILTIGQNNALIGFNDGPSTVTINSGGTMTTADGVATHTGTVILTAGAAPAPVLSSGTPDAVFGSYSFRSGRSLTMGGAANSFITVTANGLEFVPGSKIDAFSGRTLTIAGTITSGQVTTSSIGTVILTAANTYAGGTTAGSGVLSINSDAALGAVPAAPATNITFATLFGTSAPTLRTNGDVTLNANRNVVINNSTMANIDTVGTNVLTINGTISNSAATGSIVKTGTGVLVLAGSNSFVANTTLTPTNAANVSRGALRLTNSNALGTNAFIIDSTASTNTGNFAVELANGVTIPGTVTYRLGGRTLTGLRNQAGSNTFNGAVTSSNTGGGYFITSQVAGETLTLGGPLSSAIVSGGLRSFTLQGAGNGVISGLVSNGIGGGTTTPTVVGLTFSGAGTWTVTNTNTYTGATAVNSGIVLINGSIATSATTIGGGILGGTGTVGAVTQTVNTNSTLAPGPQGTEGTAAAVGTLNSGNVALAGGNSFTVDLASPTSTDLLNVVGTVNLGNANLNVNLGFAPTTGQVITIITNDLADAVTGTFVQNNTVSASFNGTPSTFAISYTGGDGNDVTLTAIANQPPVNLFNGVSFNTPPPPPVQTVDEDSQLVFSAARNNTISVNDPDIGNSPLQVTVQVDRGKLNLGTLTGVTGVSGSGTGSITFSGSQANVNTALNGLTFTPDNNDTNGATLTITTRDQQGPTATGPTGVDTDSLSISINPINDAPTVTTTTGSVPYIENDPPTVIDAGIQVVDVDTGSNLVGATVSLGSNFVTGEDVLAFDTTVRPSITGSFDPAFGVLTLSGSASPDDYQAVLRTVTYQNLSDNPSTRPRTASFVVNDGALTGSATRTITITAVNDAPVVSGVETSTVTFTEGGAPVTITSGLTITDVDSTTLRGATVTLANFVATEDVLSFTSPANSNITGTYNAATGVLTLTGPATTTLASYRDALLSVTYSNTSQNPSTATRTATFQVDDGGAVSNLSDTASTTNNASRNIAVVATNNPPTLSGIEAAPLVFTEGNAATVITTSLTVSDVDSPNLASATVRFTPATYVSGEDVLSLPVQPNIMGIFNPTTGVLTLSGTATVAEYQTALRSVRYSNTSDNPSTADRVVAFQVNDGTAPSNVVTRTINVTAVNDAPVVAGVPAGALVYIEANPPTAAPIAPAITVADADSITLTGATVRFTAGFASGQDVLAFTIPSNSNITGSYNATTGVLTLSGPSRVSNYEAALQSVTYTNTSNAPSTSTRTVSFQVNDGSAANAASNAPTRDITVTPTNDAPTLAAITPNPLNIPINAPQQTVNLTGITDGGDGGQTLVVTAAILPGSAPGVITNPTVSYTSPNTTGTLTFTPIAGQFGTVTIRVTVSDSGGALTTTRDLTVNVGPVDASPVNTVPPAQSTLEDTPLVLSGTSAISVNDADDATLSVTLTATNGTLTLSQVTGLTFNSGANGTATFKVTGTKANLNAALNGLRFVPALDYFGPARITIVTSDGDAAQDDTDVVAITVSAVNDTPTLAANGGLTVNEGSAGNAITNTMLLVNDVDNSTAQRRFTLTAIPANGTLLRGASPLAVGQAFTQADIDAGAIKYSHDGSETTSDSFSFTVSDGAGGSIAERTFDIVVRAVNDAPSISNIADQSVNRNSSTSAIAFTIGDAETAAANLTVTATASDASLVPASGIVLGGSGANRTITITPAFRRVGRVNITVRVSDGVLSTSNVFVLTIVGSNAAPVAVKDAYSTTEDVALTVAAPGVLANDTDLERDDLTAVLAADAGHGSVKLNADGSFTYTPALNFTGADSFSYRANDGSVSGNVVAVSIALRAVNDAPVALDQSLSTPEETPLDITFSATDVDSVVEGLAFRVVTAPQHGTLGGDGPRRRYIPEANFSGVDSFTFVASDGQATSEPATITINVGASNDAPVAIEDKFTTREDTPINLQVLANDSDPERDTIRIVRVAVTVASHGTVTLNGNGTLRFVPERNFAGVGAFTYTISDGSLEDTTNVSVTISPVNDAPVAFSQVVSMRQDKSLPIALFATDVDSNSTFRFSIVRRPLHGTITAFAGTKTLTYTPARGFVGNDSFTFRASDGLLASNLASVTIRVLSSTQSNATNRAPVAVADTYAARGPLQVPAASGVLKNDTDADGNPLSAVLKSSTKSGTLELRADGSFIYRPAISFSGRDSFTYSASDGRVESAPTTVTLQATPLPDTTAPVVTIAGGAQRAVTRLVPIRGSAADVYVNATGLVATSDLRDVVVMLQRANGDYWNGKSYQSEPFSLPTKLEGRAFYALPESSMPPLAQSPFGRYFWTAIATDNAGNSARAEQVMVVSSAPSA